MNNSIEELIGLTITKITKSDDEILFYTSGGNFKMYHQQNCCERVSIDDINGDLSDLVNTPVLSAEETSNNDNKEQYGDDSFTWTFYHIRTNKGTVTIKWYGSSNGYYSEDVDFEKL